MTEEIRCRKKVVQYAIKYKNCHKRWFTSVCGSFYKIVG